MKLMLFLGLFLPLTTFGAADYYRLSWRSNPATSMVIAWHQVSGKTPVVHYGTEDHGQDADRYAFKQKPDRILSYRKMNNHFVRLEGLTPDTAYYFVISDSEGVGKRLWFKTAPDKVQPFTFIAGGDSRTQPPQRREGNKLVAKLRPLFIVFGGDYSNSGSAADWHRWLSDWQLTISEDGRIYPIVATHGNHENKDMEMVWNIFDTPNPDQYYSMGFCDELLRIWVLNSELEAIQPEKVPAQQAWIETDLPKYPNANWKVATYHRPMRAHTAGKAEGKSRIAAWAQLFYNNRVDLVIESDTHMVKRTYPLRPSEDEESYESFVRDDKNGTTFIGEGSWGAPKRPANDDKPWTMASDSFYQFKWIQVFPKEMLIRTVKFENTDAVESLTEENLFKEPKNMVFWEPEVGKILRLPFDSLHESYNEPIESRTLLPIGSVWSWSLDGETWEKGAGPLGYGDKKIITTVLTAGPKPLSALFKNSFNIDDPSTITRLFFDVQADDGCIVKLNGNEVIRHNLPKGELNANSRATATVSGNGESAKTSFPIDLKHLKAGKNTIEAQVFQVSSGSSDLIFDLAVRAK